MTAVAKRRMTRDGLAVSSREPLLDVAERLMAKQGYAATSVSAICKAAGVSVTSLYWHFDSKDGLVAAVMERGAQQWFASLPRWEDQAGGTGPRTEALVRGGAAAVGAHPLFLRLFYLLALEGAGAEVAEIVQRVRAQAVSYFRDAATAMLVAEWASEDSGAAPGPEIIAAAAEELTRFAVAYSDGCFFAAQLETTQTDLTRMYADLAVALRALAPIALARAAPRQRPTT